MNKITEIYLNAANVGELNPMPDIKNVSYIHAGYQVTSAVSEEEKEYLGKGMISTMLPYMLQDNYERDKKLTKYRAVILENEYLQATFLPQFGARLWRLYDKKHQKELLYTNSVLQPCNFALRNAWFSGGVEFNIGIKGHSPLTCESMFTELIGSHAVRFYEFERIRGVSYSITAVLPENSETLYIRPRIENSSKETKQMYWWSNIAFPEKEKTRVIVPAHEAIHCSYREDHYEVDKNAIPLYNSIDISYPLNVSASADYFYKIPKSERKWIAAVDPNGDGLLQYSDSFLKGRKLFLWGNKTGGRHWNEFLSEKGQAYVEIQAGLAYTQLEHIPMPSGEIWEWTEGYTYLDGTNNKFYGNWDEAIEEVNKILEEKIINKASIAPENLWNLSAEGEKRLVFYGSGWGALENKIRKLRGEERIDSVCTYPELKEKSVEDFYCLIENGFIPERSVDVPPQGYVVGEFWEKKLKDSLKNTAARHWYTYLQIGVVEYALGNIEEAEAAWLQSIQRTPSLWAYRNLGMLYLNELKEKEKGLIYMDKAYSMAIASDLYSFIKEYANVLTANGQDEKWLKIYQELSPTLQKKGRLKVYVALAKLHLGEPEAAAQIINPNFILSDVKEGELSLSVLWKEIHKAIVIKETGLNSVEAEKKALAEYPLPKELDFRMHD